MTTKKTAHSTGISRTMTDLLLECSVLLHAATCTSWVATDTCNGDAVPCQSCSRTPDEHKLHTTCSSSVKTAFWFSQRHNRHLHSFFNFTTYAGTCSEKLHTLLFLGVFQKLRKAIISLMSLYVRPSAWHSVPTGWIFFNFYIWVFFENLSRKFKFH
jgi:hypothetical protein